MITTERVKSAAKTAAGKVKSGVESAEEKAKTTVKSRYEDYKGEKARRKQVKEEARKEAEAEQIRKRTKERIRKKYSGSGVGRKIKNFAAKVQVLGEDTGGAFSDTGDRGDKLALSGSRDMFGSGKSADDFFSGSGKSVDLDIGGGENLFKSKKQDIKFF